MSNICNTCNTCDKFKKKVHICFKCKHTTCRQCLIKHLSVTFPFVCINPTCGCKLTNVVKTVGETWLYSVLWLRINNNFLSNSDKQIVDVCQQNIVNLRSDIQEKTNQYSIERNILYTKTDEIRYMINQIILAKPSVQTVNGLIRKCPTSDCLGMITVDCTGGTTGGTNECGMCYTVLCKQCLEVKLDDTHTCEPDILESVKVIFKDTKPCPGCGISIYKIEGCYQMWCTHCHTTFHYRTGEVLNERIHNPHYIEWMNTNQHVANNEEEHGINYNTLTRIARLKGDEVRHVNDLVRIYNHVQLVEMENVNTTLRELTNEEAYSKKRAYYIMKKISVEYYKDWLYNRDRLYHKYTHLLAVYTKFIMLLREELTKYITDMNYEMTNIQNILDIVNKESLEYSQLYEHKFPYFNLKNNKIAIETRLKRFKLEPIVIESCRPTCDICVDTFNKTSRKQTKCSKCDIHVCIRCASKYFLESINEEHCMNCKEPWNRTILIQNFGISWYKNKFKNHRKDILFEREKLQIQNTMELVERLKMVDDLTKERSNIYYTLQKAAFKHKEYVSCIEKQISASFEAIWRIKKMYLPI